MAKPLSIESKKAYARKSRVDNYTASMRLEGIQTAESRNAKTQTKAQLIAKHKANV